MVVVAAYHVDQPSTRPRDHEILRFGPPDPTDIGARPALPSAACRIATVTYTLTPPEPRIHPTEPGCLTPGRSGLGQVAVRRPGERLALRPARSDRTARADVHRLAGPRLALCFEPELRYADGVARFLTGTPSVPALYAATTGYEVIEAVGVARIRARSLEQTGLVIRLADQLEGSSGADSQTRSSYQRPPESLTDG